MNFSRRPKHFRASCSAARSVGQFIRARGNRRASRMPGIFVRNVHPSSCALNYSQWNSVIISAHSALNSEKAAEARVRVHRVANNSAISMKWNHRHLSQFTTYKKNRGNPPATAAASCIARYFRVATALDALPRWVVCYPFVRATTTGKVNKAAFARFRKITAAADAHPLRGEERRHAHENSSFYELNERSEESVSQITRETTMT